MPHREEILFLFAGVLMVLFWYYIMLCFGGAIH